jgi:CHAT domain-containing protein/tetratricopeptide (TPR) repeat protein
MTLLPPCSHITRSLPLLHSAILLIAAAVAPAAISSQVVLSLGASVEGELRAGGSRSYQLYLPKEHYAHVVVTQKGVALSATIYAPTGERLASGERPNRLHGPRPIHLVTGIEGAYRLEVKETEGTSGPYAVTVVEVRPATARDRRLVDAQAVFSEGRQAFSKNTKEEFEAAIEKYLATLAIYREIDEPVGLALTMTELGLACDRLGRIKQAEEWYAQAVAIWRRARDPQGEARALNNLGSMFMYQSEARKAITIFKEALSLWRTSGDPNGEARTLFNLGGAFDYLGEPQESLSHYQSALQTWRRGGDPQGPPWALNNIGMAYTTLGHYDWAVDYFQNALAHWRALGNPASEAQALNGLGEAHLNMADYRQAMEEFTSAITLRRKTGDERILGRLLANLATTFRLIGQNQEAVKTYTEALALARKTSYPWLEAEALSHLGELAAQDPAPGQIENARELYRFALALSHDFGLYQIENLTLYRQAQLEQSLGRLSAARESIEPALASVESVRARVANQELRASFFATSQDYFELYVDLLMQLHKEDPAAGYDQLALRAHERSVARSLLEQLAEVRAEIRQGVEPELTERLQTLRRRLAEQTNRRLSLLMGRAPGDEVKQIESVIDRLTDEYEQVETRIRQKSPRFDALTMPQPVELAEIQRQLDEQTLLLQYALGRQRSYLWVVSRDSVESFVLPRRDEIEIAVRQVYETVSIRGADTQYWPAAARLSQMILSPVARRLSNQRLVIVPHGVLHSVSFSALPHPRSLSAAASQPMIVDHEICYAPSASVLSSLRRKGMRHSSAPPKILVLADPVFSADDPRVRHQGALLRDRAAMKFDLAASATRDVSPPNADREKIELRSLSHTRIEAKAIQSLAGANSTFVKYDFQANREVVTDAPLKQYDILHFATHALIHDQRPALSGIVLSMVDENGSRRNGFLQLHDIYSLDLAAELVVLSACQTARGKEVRGEGVIGLTRGFLYSGAQRVVSSLWSVDSLATSELMTHFYRSRLRQGLRPAAALRLAQLAMWRQRGRQSPHFWGAFILHGDWE